MAKQLQIRGGTTVQHSTFTGALREITIDTDKDVIVVHDGTTVGGFPLAKQTSVDSKVTKVTSTDNAIVRFDGVTGAVQNSGVIIDDGGNVGSGTQSFNGFGGSGFKNYIINGSFNIDQYQRGAQSNWNSANCYIDRFLVVNSSSVVRNGAGANNPIGTGLHNHLSITKTAGADTQIIQRWEIPKDKAKQFLNGRTLTFSCLVLAETANFVEYLFFIKNGTSVNSYEVTTFNITKNNEAGIWTRVTGTITNIQWTYEAGEYIEIRLDPVDGLAGNLHTTGWQLEEGSIATPFEQRPYGLELSLCQRYYEKSYADSVAIGTLTNENAYCTSNLSPYLFHSPIVNFKVPKRIQPTIVIYNPYASNTGNAIEYNTGSVAVSDRPIYPLNVGKNCMKVQSTNGSLVTGNFVLFHYTASAEL